MPKKRTQVRTNWLISVDRSVADKVDFFLLDPSKLRVRYGSRTELANMLFSEWVADIEAGRRKLIIPGVDNLAE